MRNIVILSALAITLLFCGGFYVNQYTSQEENTKEIVIPGLGAWDEKIYVTEEKGEAHIRWDLYNLNIDNLMIRALAKTVTRGKL